MAFVEGFKKFMGMSPLDEEDEFSEDNIYGDYKPENKLDNSSSEAFKSDVQFTKNSFINKEDKGNNSSMEDIGLNTMSGLGYDTYSGLNERLFGSSQPAPSSVAPAVSESKKEPEKTSVDMHKVVMFKPVSFDDASDIAIALLGKNTVIINTESIDNELRRRIVDFISGVAYADNADIKKASNTTFVITPSNVLLEGEGIADDDYDVKSLGRDGEHYY